MCHNNMPQCGWVGSMSFLLSLHPTCGQQGPLDIVVCLLAKPLIPGLPSQGVLEFLPSFILFRKL